ncbi:MAG TPA: glycosyltransferase [Candidatus Hydrogenedentes bacterium]|nr:glycosyltransferase [Candidatus Hydrogenedentota bacterium]
MKTSETMQPSFTCFAPGVALPVSATYDCVILIEEAVSQLQDEGCLQDILDRLSKNGILMAVLPTIYIDTLPDETARLLEGLGLFQFSPDPVGDGLALLTFARSTFDPLAHARHLSEAGMPGRAAALLEWLTRRTPLSEEQRAGIAVEMLRHFRRAAEMIDPTANHGLLFHAQKEFHVAVHAWPRRHELYREHAAIWRRFGNDDYAARLLRSVLHVAEDDATRSALARCAPVNTVQPTVETLREWTGNKKAPRVLVLTHHASDYGMDSLYDGLSQVLGFENVVEYPWKPTLHGLDEAATLKYPCWFDYPGTARSPEALVQELRDGLFDVIVFADFVERTNRDEILRILDAAPDTPVVAYDPWDDGSATQKSACAYLNGRLIAAYFKREMLACLDYGENAYPLPFGYPDRHVPSLLPERRTTDLFWAGKRLFGTRSLYLDYLNQVLQRTLDRSLPQEAYRRAIADSRIGLSFFGFGFDTVRYWELAANGCMILAERPLIRIPFNFVAGESAVFFDDLAELEEKLNYYMAHTDTAEEVARAGREHFLRYHTTSARARQFLGTIEALI